MFMDLNDLRKDHGLVKINKYINYYLYFFYQF